MLRTCHLTVKIQFSVLFTFWSSNLEALFRAHTHTDRNYGPGLDLSTTNKLIPLRYQLSILAISSELPQR